MEKVSCSVIYSQIHVDHPITIVWLMGRCLAAAALQLPTALNFTVHRRQFSDGLLANFVGFSFNTQTCRSSAPHVAAAAAHLFPL